MRRLHSRATLDTSIKARTSFLRLGRPGLSMGSPIGQVVGALFAGYPMEWYGRKLTFAACVIATAGCIFIQFFARSLPVLLTGELLGSSVGLLRSYRTRICLGSVSCRPPRYLHRLCQTCASSWVSSLPMESLPEPRLLTRIGLVALRSQSSGYGH